MAFTNGTRLGAYEIVAPIGAGGMGEVYRATDTHLKRQVALKVLPEALASDAERLARFQREAEVLASLNHPNIAAVYGLEKSAGITALVMELVEGPTLADRIASGPIPWDEALPIVSQLADALEGAHERAIVHRDLKPANIKVRDDGTVKVLDFGLAKAIDPAAVATSPNHSMSPTITTPAMTQMGMILGTAAYMSPEQAKGRPADKRSDVWAFGCVLYELLTGRRAFDGEDTTDVLGAVVRLEPDWRALPSDVPAIVRSLLQQCLVKDRQRRIADIAAARFVLEHHEVVNPAPSPLRRAWRPRTALVIGGALAIGVLATALPWLWTRPAPARVVRTTIAGSDATALSLSGFWLDVAITPDGSRVVFHGNEQLLVRALDESEPRVLVRGAVRNPFISPDGQWVGFFEGTALKKVAITGGPAETITTVPGDSAGAAWGSDDTIVFASGDPTTGLLRVSAAGGPTAELTTPSSGERDHVFPQWLPGRMAVLFTIFPSVGSADDAQIAVLDLRTGTSKVLIRGGSDARYVASEHLVYGAAGTLRAVGFDPGRLEIRGAPAPVLEGVSMTRVGLVQAAVADNGSLVYVRGGGDPQRTLVSVDRQGRSTPLPGLPPDIYRQVRVSPDGNRLALTAGGDIWIYDIKRGTRSRLTTDPAQDAHPFWRPDGQRVIFRSMRAGYPELFVRAADGTGTDERLFSGAKDLTDLFVTSRSADDTHVVFTEVPQNIQNRIGDVALDSPSDARILVRGDFSSARGAVSPDGRWIAYESNSSGRYEIFIERYPNLGNRQQISDRGGRDPRWSSAGNELFFATENGAEMYAVPVKSGTTLEAGRPQRLFEAAMVPIVVGDSPYDVAPDGRFLILRRARGDADDGTQGTLVLVQNWFEELRQRVPTSTR